jgi:excisionase family DNA binding protein
MDNTKDGKICRTTLTAKEAATYIGISYWLLCELVKRKEIPCIRVGGRILFRLESLSKWLEGCENSSIQKDETTNEDYGVLRRAKA